MRLHFCALFLVFKQGYSFLIVTSTTCTSWSFHLSSSSLDSDNYSERIPTSASEAIEIATTPFQILQAGQLLIPPGGETLHYQKQLVHQKRRQTASINAIKKLSKLLVGSAQDITAKRRYVTSNPSFLHIVKCAAGRISNTSSINEFELKNYIQLIRSCAIMDPLPAPVLHELAFVFKALDNFVAQDISRNSPSSCSPAQIDGIASTFSRLQSLLSLSSLPHVAARHHALNLPFRLLPNLIDRATGTSVCVSSIAKEVPFKAEKIVTLNGKKVTERRETCESPK